MQTGFIFQSVALMATMSAYENVEFGMRIAGVPAAERKKRAEESLELVGLAKRMTHRPQEMSGGEQQRIAIARVMLKNSPIIVLDEATAFADPENEALVQKAFKELSQDKTVIMIAHRLTTVRNADKIFVLKDGQIEDAGTHDELVSSGSLYAKMWRDYQTSIGWKVTARNAEVEMKGGAK